jgi:hypothetical protein
MNMMHSNMDRAEFAKIVETQPGLYLLVLIVATYPALDLDRLEPSEIEKMSQKLGNNNLLRTAGDIQLDLRYADSLAKFLRDLPDFPSEEEIEHQFNEVDVMVRFSAMVRRMQGEMVDMKEYVNNKLDQLPTISTTTPSISEDLGEPGPSVPYVPPLRLSRPQPGLPFPTWGHRNAHSSPSIAASDRHIGGTYPETQWQVPPPSPAGPAHAGSAIYAVEDEVFHFQDALDALLATHEVNMVRSPLSPPTASLDEQKGTQDTDFSDLDHCESTAMDTEGGSPRSDRTETGDSYIFPMEKEEKEDEHECESFLQYYGAPAESI